MTDTMLEELAQVVHLSEKWREDRTYTAWVHVSVAAVDFNTSHHTTIAQNAEESKRLKALEQAMDEAIDIGKFLSVDWMRSRADEIMREMMGT